MGSGRLKLNTEDIHRDDVPLAIKDLINICSKYERNDRFEFIEVKSILFNTKFYFIELIFKLKDK